jgi:hypothetical protein
MRTSLNVAAAEPVAMNYGGEFKRAADSPRRRSPRGVNGAIAEAGEKEIKTAPRTREGGHRKCKFSEIIRPHPPPWLCQAFRTKPPEDRSRLIEDNQLGLGLHDSRC